MRGVFGVLSLLVVVAIVAAVARTQGPAEAGATPAERSQQAQRQVADDVKRLMQQAPARDQSGGY